jgi:hypothetical protein
VIALQGNAVASGTLNSLDDGYALTWVNSAGKWEAQPSKSYFVGNYTSITSSYLATTATQLVLVGSLSGAITVTLPASPTDGQLLTIKDGAASASTYNITVSGNGHNIDGLSSVLISTNYDTLTVFFGSSYWSIIN